ncbi:MAG TPA: PepSY-like domain-containing protein [Pirellulales bacterium]|nr:PepSY-like domain-containing protein [Pirellulales bacterium]
MRYVLATSVLTLGLMLLTVDARALAKEEDVPLDQVPKVVLEAVKAKFPGAKLTEAAKETEDGKTTYEIGLEHKGQEYSVSLTAAGKITEIEREIEIKELPKAVSDAIKKKYPKGKMEKAEEVTAGGKTTYEVVVEASDDKDVEVTVDASGKILKEEAEEEEDDEDDDDK